jgi:hypothetical protein
VFQYGPAYLLAASTCSMTAKGIIAKRCRRKASQQGRYNLMGRGLTLGGKPLAICNAASKTLKGV